MKVIWNTNLHFIFPSNIKKSLLMWGYPINSEVSSEIDNNPLYQNTSANVSPVFRQIYPSWNSHSSFSPSEAIPKRVSLCKWNLIFHPLFQHSPENYKVTNEIYDMRSQMYWNWLNLPRSITDFWTKCHVLQTVAFDMNFYF